MPVLTAIDVIGIQSYVFASNRLHDVVGASRIVEWATDREGCLNVRDAPKPEVIMAAGGNAVLGFGSLDEAKGFVLRYTRRLLEDAPGLDVAVAHHEYQPGSLARGLLALNVKLAAAKLNRRPHTPQLGLGVTRPCAITGLPASESSSPFGEEQWVARRIAKIREQAERAGDKWRLLLDELAQGAKHLQGRKLRFPHDLDNLGRTREETSLIGVVHIDGNGVGSRIQHWLVAQQHAADESVKDNIRKWSNALDELVESVFRAVLKRLIDHIAPNEQRPSVWQVRGQLGSPTQLDFDLSCEGDTIWLPIRPILLGGDDLTFVCDSRLALDLTTAALKAFGDKSRDSVGLKTLGGKSITACAGAALVRAHAPFSRAYELCESLCASAKRAKRKADTDDGSDTDGWLDWHIGAVRPDESLDEIRRRQYSAGKLTCRPFPLDGDAATRLTWRWLDTELLGDASGNGDSKGFRNPRVWGERRNKVKTLATLLRESEQAIKAQLDAWRLIEPRIGLPTPLDASGFNGARTPLLDAVELLDIHLRLEEPPEKSPATEREVTRRKEQMPQ